MFWYFMLKNVYSEIFKLANVQLLLARNFLGNVLAFPSIFRLAEVTFSEAGKNEASVFSTKASHHEFASFPTHIVDNILYFFLLYYYNW